MQTPHPTRHDDTPGRDAGKTPPELACKIVNAQWALIAGRLPYRTARERLAAMEAAGLVHNEAYFARLATGALG